MLRICRQCSARYDGDPGSTLCPDCVKANRQDTRRTRICRTCGATFPGGPRAWYCPSCRAERQRRQSKDAYWRAKTGNTRKIGSTDLCEICQQPYVVNSGLQRYCPECAPEAIREADRQQGRAWYAENGDPAYRKQQRNDQAAAIPCKVCGKAFIPSGKSLTCSPECSSALRRQSSATAERRNQDRRNQARREREAKKRAAMTPEELRTHREQVNARARKNYRKRKEKNNAQNN